MKKQNIVFLAVLALLLIFGIGTSLQKKQRAESLGFLASANARTFVPDYAVTYGPADARVFIVDFFDPACETCAQLAGPVHKLVTEHPGQVRLVLRHAPFHPGSDQVVKMLLAAKAQGKYDEALELMFATQSSWTANHHADVDLLWSLLPRAGVDVDRLRTDMAAPVIDDEVAQDLADAKILGVRQTPEFFVNGKPLPTWGYDQLVTLVESEIKLQYP